MTDFREDGAAALERAASYLERVGDLPVLAQVEPGELSAQLPAAGPEQGEQFADVLRDLDELLLPAMTNWQSPRFFSYFAVTSSEPAILAEMLAAALNQVALVWRASPASTELELLVADWVRQRLGLPEGWHNEENGRLESRVNASGEIFITHTKLDGRYVLRLAIGNARTTEADVLRPWDVLNREAA